METLIQSGKKEVNNEYVRCQICGRYQEMPSGYRHDLQVSEIKGTFMTRSSKEWDDQLGGHPLELCVCWDCVEQVMRGAVGVVGAVIQKRKEQNAL